MKKEAACCYLGFYNVRCMLVVLERNTGIHLHPEAVVARVDRSPSGEHPQSLQGCGQTCNTKASWSQGS